MSLEGWKKDFEAYKRTVIEPRERRKAKAQNRNQAYQTLKERYPEDYRDILHNLNSKDPRIKW